MRGGLHVTLIVLALSAVLCSGALLSQTQSDSASTQTQSATSSPSSSATLDPTFTSSPIPTIDELATSSAAGEATSSAADTARALTQTTIARATDEAMRSEAFDALERERSDAHAIAIAQLREIEAKRAIVELTLNPTAVSISQTEDARQLWRTIERDRIEDEAHAKLVEQQLEDEKNVSRAQSLGLIALYAGLPIALVVGVIMIAHAKSQSMKAERDARLAQIEANRAIAELEHELQMRRAEILNLKSRVPVNSARGSIDIDARMTLDRLRALVNAAVLASGPSSSVLTWSGDPIWKKEGVEISHREWAACADELERLGWLEKRVQGKPTKLTDGATLGDIQRALYDVLQPSSDPPTLEEETEIAVPV